MRRNSRPTVLLEEVDVGALVEEAIGSLRKPAQRIIEKAKATIERIREEMRKRIVEKLIPLVQLTKDGETVEIPEDPVEAIEFLAKHPETARLITPEIRALVEAYRGMVNAVAEVDTEGKARDKAKRTPRKRPRGRRETNGVKVGKSRGLTSPGGPIEQQILKATARKGAEFKNSRAFAHGFSCSIEAVRLVTKRLVDEGQIKQHGLRSRAYYTRA